MVYRQRFDHHSLMDELASLLEDLLDTECECSAYGKVLVVYCDFTPQQVNVNRLEGVARDLGFESNSERRSVLLDFIFSKHIAPELGKKTYFYIRLPGLPGQDMPRWISLNAFNHLLTVWK